jgi:2-polyprenyl-3-methyl-5-hydroxy-6-metoxy-1,4-benzoquinol methylase
MRFEMLPELVDYSKHYEKWHSPTVKHAEEMSRFYEKIFGRFLQIDSNKKILDVGCGMGFFLWFLQQKGFKNIFGIDADEGQILNAKKLNLPALHVDNLQSFIDKPEKFDLIFLIDVLEHIPQVAQIEVLAALKEKLNPEGRLILTVPNANSSIASRWRYIDWTHVTSFTESSLSHAILSAGFKNLFVTSTPIYRIGEEKLQVIKKLTQIIFSRASMLMNRIHLIGNLGWNEGASLPIDVNLLAVCEGVAIS